MYTVGYYTGLLSGLILGTAGGFVLSVFWRGYRDDDILEDESSTTAVSGTITLNFSIQTETLANLLSSVISHNSETNVPFDEPKPAEGATTDDETPVDEMTGIFMEEAAKVSSANTPAATQSQPTVPVAQSVSPPAPTRGGYVTMSQLEAARDAHLKEGGRSAMPDNYKNFSVPQKTLSRREELSIIHEFRGIVGMTLEEARKVVKQEGGYDIRVLYIGATRMPAGDSTYSPTCLGVRVTLDREAGNLHDLEGLENALLNQDARITEIIDVGGVDLNNRGSINL